MTSDDFSPGFSSALLQRLQSSRTKLDAFIDSTIYRVEHACDDNLKLVEEKQREVCNLLHILHQVQSKRGVAESSKAVTNDDGGVAAQRNKIQQKQSQMQCEMQHLSQEVESIQTQLVSISQEKQNYQKQAVEVLKKKQFVEQKKQTKIEDLTKGLVQYRLLGLDFENDGDCLWFKFTHLDPKDTYRTFSFALSMADGENYQVAQCNPSLPEEPVRVIVQQLNASNDDIAALARSMRKEFKKHYA